MRHAADADKLLEILGDELRAVVADDPRRLAGKLFAGALEDRLDIQFGHLLADFPVHDVSADSRPKRCTYSKKCRPGSDN